MATFNGIPKRSLSLLLLTNAVIPLIIGLFASGFFPYKPFITGRNTYPVDGGLPPAPVFDKVIFMVIDALRSDFVYSNESSFYFVQSLIRDGAAIPFTAHAASPTITMPKIKALTTGSIPSFLDVILNFAESDTTSTLASQDTWPGQLGAKPQGKLLMYGDDTWLKLFPDVFSRSDGTTSFFVSDFTEVDNNVTRHVSPELANSDWNGMIMHYLGLDHIGHKSGPRSPHMHPKQREMDDIVRQIYGALESKAHLRSTLFVLCGDHGMNEAGNHGGSAPGETSPALVFMSPKLRTISKGLVSPVLTVEDEFQYYEVVEQSDVAPTLAGLLGFPIPLNNLGVFIDRFLAFWPTDDDKMKLLTQNAQQIYDIVKATFGEPRRGDDAEYSSCERTKDDAELLHCLWFAAGLAQRSSAEIEEKVGSLMTFLKHAQRVMSSTASNYDVDKLQFGVGLMVLSTAGIGYAAILAILPMKKTMVLILALCSAYGGMMFASSFVEEEHHFWYWSLSGWLAILWTKGMRKTNLKMTKGVALVVLLGAFRVIRRWNQTGQKHAGAPDIGRTYLSTEPILLWALIVLTFIAEGASLYYAARPMRSNALFLVGIGVLLMAAIGFKISFTAADAPELLPSTVLSLLEVLIQLPLTAQAQSVFIGLGILTTGVLVRNKIIKRDSVTPQQTLQALHALLTILLITQSRAINIPLFFLFKIQFEIMRRLRLHPDEITMGSILLQYSSFFALGGTNAISSVDLSSAYNGVSSYNVLAVGILTFVSNWTGPIWWSLASCILLLERRDGGTGPLLRHMILRTLFLSASLMSVMGACTVLRTHLFIWTVFSPKYLYSMAWSLAQHLIVDSILAGAIWGLATST